MDKPVTPWGINHVVLNVRDIEESHRFWTDVVGFHQVGEVRKTPTRPNPRKMRFYSGDKGGHTHHHDLALVENRELPEPPKEWSLSTPMQVNHIAITLPSREAWLAQLAFLKNSGIKLDLRIDHGMTHSVYIHDPNGYGVEFLYDLPKEVWQGDIDAALNHAEFLPTEGPDAIEDRIDNIPQFGRITP